MNILGKVLNAADKDCDALDFLLAYGSLNKSYRIIDRFLRIRTSFYPEGISWIQSYNEIYLKEKNLLKRKVHLLLDFFINNP